MRCGASLSGRVLKADSVYVRVNAPRSGPWKRRCFIARPADSVSATTCPGRVLHSLRKDTKYPPSAATGRRRRHEMLRISFLTSIESCLRCGECVMSGFKEEIDALRSKASISCFLSLCFFLSLSGKREKEAIIPGWGLCPPREFPFCCSLQR